MTWTNVLVDAETPVAGQFSRRYSHICEVFNNKIWFMGGKDGTNLFNDVWSSSDGVTWINALVDGHTEWSRRFSFSLVDYEGELFVIGGNDGNRLNDVHSSNLTVNAVATSDTSLQQRMPTVVNGLEFAENNVIQTGTGTLTGANWTEKSTAWAIKQYATSIIFKGKMWVIGGHTGSAYSNKIWSTSDGTTWTDEPAGTRWSARYAHVCLVFNNKIWVLGGHDGAVKNDIWSSPDGLTWTEESAGSHWTARRYHSGVVFDNKMWIMGGLSAVSTLYTNDIWSSPDGITWTEESAGSRWSGRRTHSSVIFDNKIWVMGGSNATTYTNDIWSSPDGLTWTEESAGSHWSIRRSHSSVVFDNKMWIMGGYNGTLYFDDIWSSTDGLTWTETTAGTHWDNRNASMAIVFKDKIWMMAGSDGTCMNDIWVSEDNITTGIKRTFTNKTDATIALKETGITGSEYDNTAVKNMHIRDIVDYNIAPNRGLTFSYKLNGAISTTLTLNKNFFKAIESAMKNAEVDMNNTFSASTQIKPFCTSNGMDCQGALNDITRGLVIGTGTTTAWDNDALVTPITNATCQAKLQVYTTPSASAGKSSIVFERDFENVSGGIVNVGEFALYGHDGTDSYQLLSGIMTKSLTAGQTLELTLTLSASV